MLLTDCTDEQLLAQALAGDEEAFTALYRRRQGPIFRFALHMSGSTQIAEEVTQDVFMFLLQRGHDFDPQRGVAGSLPVRRGQELCAPRAGAELSGERVEQSDRRRSRLPDGGERSQRRHGATPDLDCGVEGSAVVARALSRSRGACAICRSMSYADAAEAVHCAIGTVRSRLHRAHDMLGKKLQHSAAVAPGISSVTARCMS